jgi:hypothetical protein
MFDDGRDSDVRAFAERCEGDRHHFRFIVSPDDALEMTDLRAFTCDLISEMERDLNTKLDWTAVDHWNTEHPLVHVIVRGKGDDGRDLVIFTGLHQLWHAGQGRAPGHLGTWAKERCRDRPRTWRANRCGSLDEARPFARDRGRA